MKRYLDYSVNDILNDTDFINWRLTGSDEHELFWGQLLCRYPHLAPIVKDAILLFKQNVRLNDFKKSDTEIDILLSDLQTDINTRKTRRRSIRQFMHIGVVAASVAILFISIWLFKKGDIEQLPVVAVSTESTIQNIKEVTLITSDSVVSMSNNAKLVYNKDIEEVVEELVFNELVVPRGRRSSLILPDGSKVWINSGTRVKFPTSFAKNQREIYVDGEIFLDVAKDTSRPFIVKTTEFDIKVLGTQFNLSVYKDDNVKSVVLVEGSVEVGFNDECIQLKPNEMMKIKSHTHNIANVNVEDYTSWKSGWLRLNSMTLEELTKRLSRYYDKNISCEPSISTQRCSGKLLLFDDLTSTIDVISKNLNIKYIQDANHIKFMPME